jgi:hypothetical protein
VHIGGSGAALYFAGKTGSDASLALGIYLGFEELIRPRVKDVVNKIKEARNTRNSERPEK